MVYRYRLPLTFRFQLIIYEQGDGIGVIVVIGVIGVIGFIGVIGNICSVVPSEK